MISRSTSSNRPSLLRTPNVATCRSWCVPYFACTPLPMPFAMMSFLWRTCNVRMKRTNIEGDFCLETVAFFILETEPRWQPLRFPITTRFEETLFDLHHYIFQNILLYRYVHCSHYLIYNLQLTSPSPSYGRVAPKVSSTKLPAV